jgi:adenosylmethionine-8-amino-7-oxononanoate aminotransferase
MDRQYIEQMASMTFVDFMATEEYLRNPCVFTRGEGVYLWDTDGKRYFDGIGGIFVANLGHKHPRLVEAMKKQLDTLTLAPPLHGISDVTLRFIERLGQLSPGTLNYIKSYSGGSESLEGALKFVRQYHKQTGKPDKMKVVSNYLSYHGATYGAMSLGGSLRKGKFEPQMGGFLKIYSPKQLRDVFGDWEKTCRFAAEQLRLTIQSENPDTVGAYVVEPICNTAGIITPTDEYFQIIRKTCDEFGVILIFDEVLTGVGKTGDLFAAQTFGVTPDIICSGKGMSSGMLPFGSMMVREDLADAFKGDPVEHRYFAHGHTYANFPLGCAVATEVLNIIEDEDLLAHSRILGKRLESNLEKLKRYGIVREVRGKGILRGVELVRDTVSNEPFTELGAALKKTALANGLIMRIDPDWFAVAPPLISTENQIDELCGLVEKSLKDALDIVSAKK